MLKDNRRSKTDLKEDGAVGGAVEGPPPANNTTNAANRETPLVKKVFRRKDFKEIVNGRS